MFWEGVAVKVTVKKWFWVVNGYKLWVVGYGLGGIALILISSIERERQNSGVNMVLT